MVNSRDLPVPGDGGNESVRAAAGPEGDIKYCRMQVRVLFFGRLKEIVGRSEEVAELSDGARVEDLFRHYGQQYPELERFRGSVAASVNQVLADWPAPLRSGDEVAFLPPVSGGSASLSRKVRAAAVGPHARDYPRGRYCGRAQSGRPRMAR